MIPTASACPYFTRYGREVSGAGRHVVSLGRERALPAGVYLVRLIRGRSVLVRRAVVLE